jgi:S1-C subfamily serine protease
MGQMDDELPPATSWGAPPDDLPPPSRRRAAGAMAGIALIVVFSLAVSAYIGRSFGNGNQPPVGSLDSGSGPLDTQSIAARVSPAVVDITASFPDGLAAGSGMVITSSGEVLTNNHVVDGADLIEAQIGGSGPTHQVRVLGTDPNDDVALLQIEGVSGLATVRTGDSSKVSVGDPVVALGNALGRQGPPSASQGRVTGLERTITATDDSGENAETLTGLIEVDANVVPGDSGGPLVDGAGRVIGMDTAASSRRFRFRSGTAQGFAIPIATAMSVVQQLRSSGVPSSPPSGPTALLGVVARDAADSVGGPGALVVQVQPGSAADGAGIVAGDVIVSLDGRDVPSAAALRAAIRAHRPGDRVQVGWVDPSGQEQSATVSLTASG